MIESEFSLSTEYMTGKYDKWFASFQHNMELLEGIGETLSGAVVGYYKDEKVDTAGDLAAKATHVFWQQAERHAESLSLACSLDDPREEETVMRCMLACALKAYDQTCPQATARQMQVWARHQPRFRLGTATAGKARTSNMGEEKTLEPSGSSLRWLARCLNDRGFAARLRRADNPDTEDQSWGVLTGLGVDINRETDSLPHALVGAALSRLKSNADGDLDLGQALHDCFEKGDQGETRLRRVLACDSLGEVVTVLRPILRLIGARDVPLAYAYLLDDLPPLSHSLGAHATALGFALLRPGRRTRPGKRTRDDLRLGRGGLTCCT